MRLLITLFLLTFCISNNAQKGKLFISSWKENEDVGLSIQASGYTYSKKGKVYYSISNSNDNIFLDLKIEDTGVQNRILKQGLIVWINMETKLTKTMGVRFPIGSIYSGSRNKHNLSNSNLNDEGNLVTPLSLANTIELIGFTGEERRFSADNFDNFRGSVKYDDHGYLNYNMVMPIAKMPVRNSKEGYGAMPFTLGIEYGAISQINVSGMPPGHRSTFGANMGAGTDSSQNDITPVLLWIKNIKLAATR